MRTALAGALAVALAACEPTFGASGALSVDRTPFAPTTCHVLTDQTGVALADAAGTRVLATIPPQTLRAWEEIHGDATVRLEQAGGAAPVELGVCGTLSLRGEGYHGQGKRAAQGTLSVSCAGTASVSGTLRFEGCF